MSKPPDDDDRPQTLWELQRRRDQHPEPGHEGGKVSDAIPRLPAESPWSPENPNPPEPLIDRSADR
jgi:hypothetical protein